MASKTKVEWWPIGLSLRVLVLTTTQSVHLAPYTQTQSFELGIDKMIMTETMAVETMTEANLALRKLKSQQQNLKKHANSSTCQNDCRACLIVMSWNLSCHFLFRRGAHKETINNIFVLPRRCVIVNTLFTQCIVSCRMVSSFRHICDHCCFSMPSLIAHVRTINIHYKSQCFKQQMSRTKQAPLHLTQKTQLPLIVGAK